jgi:crossover junction endodeoxyribonuclease RusA
MIVSLPLPPSANLYWRIWRGRAVVSNEARAYKQHAALAAKAQGLRPFRNGDVIVSIRIFRPTKRGDLDNRIKVLLDALRGVAYRDDSQVVGLQAVQFEDAENPRVEMGIVRSNAPPELFSELVGPVGKSGFKAKPKPLGPVIRSASWKPTPA